MDVVTAMVISTLVAILFEFVRYRNLKEVMASFKLFFEGMGKIPCFRGLPDRLR